MDVVLVLSEVFSHLEFEKPVPHSELVLVCWGYSEVEYFHSESVVAAVARVKICERGLDVLLCNMWEILLIVFFVASP